MKLKFSLLFSFLFLNYSSHALSKTTCQIPFEKLGLCGELKSLGKIDRKNPASFSLRFHAKESPGKTVFLKSKPKAKLWMIMDGGHGHGSEELTIEMTKDQTYKVDNAWFLMMGEWQIKVEAEMDGKTEEQMAKICVGRKAKDSFIGECI